MEHTFESAYYLFLKDKRFSERSLKRHLKNMKRSLAFLKDTPLSDIDNTKLKQLMSPFFRDQGVDPKKMYRTGLFGHPLGVSKRIAA